MSFEVKEKTEVRLVFLGAGGVGKTCTPIVVIGNKVDRHAERKVPSEDVLSTVEMDWNHIFLESSAKDNLQHTKSVSDLLLCAGLPSGGAADCACMWVQSLINVCSKLA
uniref:Uncharacterized protein n=1 Tax=Kryptolebias marmoratus TaxID=37003 RepID=A0A3Q3A5B7_KRYMA